MNKIIAFQKIINEEIKKLSPQIGNQPAELYEPIIYTLQLGGKRMRPVLLLLACDMFGGNTNRAIAPSIGIELFHNFTLVHDDIMDNAPLRRGEPTVHQKWNNNIAVISGDAMLVKAYQFIAQCEQALLPDVLSVFNTVAIQVCEGQQLDMNYEKAGKVSISEYINMINLKTAVLLAGSLKIGALIGGAKEEDAQYLYEFGRNIGIAFQLQDDLLDVYGDEKKFGKQVGGDIISNKKTYLLLKALELANDTTLKELNNWIQLSNFDAKEKVKAVTAIYDSLNIPELTQKEIHLYCEKGLAFLSKISIEDSKKEVLRTFADELMVREV